MAKIIRKTNKNTKSSRSSRSSRRSKRSSHSLSKVMKGGDDGRYVFPSSYFGGKPSGYFQDGSPELATSTTQRAVSQGVTWGNYAGPNLYPSITGGGCGCGGKRNNKNKSRKSRKSKQVIKHKKSKCKGNKTH